MTVPTRPRPRLGQLLPYALTSASLVAVFLVHSPWLPMDAQAVGHALVNLTGTEVRWTMFSADPRGDALDLWADVEYPSVTSRWGIDDYGSGGLRYHRWAVFAETAVLGRPAAQLQGLADWLSDRSPEPVDGVVVYGSIRKPGEPGDPRPEPLASVLFETGQP